MPRFRNMTSGPKGIRDKAGVLHMVEAGQVSDNLQPMKGDPNEEWFGDPDDTLEDRGADIASRISEQDQEAIRAQFEQLRDNYEAQLSEARGSLSEVEDERDELRTEIEQLKAQLAEATRSDAGDGSNERPALSGKNKPELLEIAEAEGVTVEDGATNAQIIEAIEAKRGQ